MKHLIFTVILLIGTTPAFAALSDSDLQRIREIVKVEVVTAEQRLRTEMHAAIEASQNRTMAAIEASEKRMMAAIEASEKRMIDRMDIKLAGLDKRVNLLPSLLIGIMALIVVAVGLPQLILAYRQRKQEHEQNAIRELREAYEEVLVQLKELKGENPASKQHDISESKHHCP